MNTKKLSVYQDKENKAIFIQPMKVKNGKFVTKSPTKDWGSANSHNVSNEELGRKIREAFEEAE